MLHKYSHVKNICGRVAETLVSVALSSCCFRNRSRDFSTPGHQPRYKIGVRAFAPSPRILLSGLSSPHSACHLPFQYYPYTAHGALRRGESSNSNVRCIVYHNPLHFFQLRDTRKDCIVYKFQLSLHYVGQNPFGSRSRT